MKIEAFDRLVARILDASEVSLVTDNAGTTRLVRTQALQEAIEDVFSEGMAAGIDLTGYCKAWVDEDGGISVDRPLPSMCPPMKPYPGTK